MPPEERTKTEKAYDYKCPKCWADPGDSCTYLPIEQPSRYSSNDLWARYRLNDKATKVPHNERRVLVPEHRPAAVRYGNRPATHRPRFYVDMTPAILTLRAIDLQEYRAMHLWLKRNASIFWRRA